MSNLMILNFHGAAVRTVTIAGEPWWVAKDVCDVLGLADGKTSIQRLDADEVHSVPLTDALGRDQLTTVINESGLYSLILRSRRPVAYTYRLRGTMAPKGGEVC
jgi:prophage antirepressor-like protein